MTVQLLSYVRAITPDRTIDDATVAIEDGRIVGVEPNARYQGAFDGRGAFCLPGLIDTHCDAIEREISPRPTAVFDIEFALRSLEQRFLGAGITTAYHGVSFADDMGGTRSITQALALVDIIAARRAERPRLDHHPLLRVQARTARSAELAGSCLAKSGDGQVLLSFEDHTPGQGQYRDLEKFKEVMRLARDGDDGPDPDADIARRLDAAKETLPIRQANLSQVEGLAARGEVRLLAHDCVDDCELDEARRRGASVAEFPVTIEAARAARERGMPVVVGAPNVLLGGSHSGNVSAEDVIAAGLCTGLASDYLPPSMLAAAFDLARRAVIDLPTAIGLVTSGPAQVAGCPDRGRLVPGAPADLILATVEGRWPRVLSVVSDTSGDLAPLLALVH
jgi:alpha-D-ribose 1-methylphosphonate 5-triphosphate diphosphatase